MQSQIQVARHYVGVIAPVTFYSLHLGNRRQRTRLESLSVSGFFGGRVGDSRNNVCPPDSWDAAQLAFFGGLVIGSQFSIGEVKRLFGRLDYLHPASRDFWLTFINQIRMRVPADRWNGILESCVKQYGFPDGIARGGSRG